MSYIPNTDQDRKAMLEILGLSDMEGLFREIPEGVRLKRGLDLPTAMSEPELLRHAGELAGSNAASDRWVCFLGGGAYDHYVPSVVGYLLSRGEFLTAYTPYQAEISQGTLQAIYEFQSMICALTGMDVANASLYDGASALAEACMMAVRVTGRSRVLVSCTVNPRYREVLATYARGAGFDIEEVPFVHAENDVGGSGVTDLERLKGAVSAVPDEVAAVVLQDPNFFGLLEPAREVGSIAASHGALFIVSCNPVSLGLLEPPGAYGADIVVGEGQPLGCGLNFGGPYLGFFATRQKFVRQMPGRVAGATLDAEGRRGYVLTLQAREQHIRREKATSNICTNQALMALAATIYLSVVGPQGLNRIAELCAAKARYAAGRLAGIPGCELVFKGPFFNEFVVRAPKPADVVLGQLMEHGILGGLDLGVFYPEMAGSMLIAVTEKRTRQEIDGLVDLMGGIVRGEG